MKPRIRTLALGAAVGLGVAAVMKRSRPIPAMRGEVVLITGASRGLGLRLAQEFAHHGCRLAICARKPDELERARQLLTSAGAEVIALTCDVSSEEQVKSMVAQVRAHYGRIDTLINNAGIIRVAPLANMTATDFADAMNVMFWGVVYPSLAVLPEMIERGRGRIAAITSVGGKVSIPHLLPYCCAKHAAVAFCEGLRAEVAMHGVKVTTIAPGLLRTGSHRNAEFKGQQEKEATWFTLGATLPLVSMDVDRAARQIVRAVAFGQSEKILSTQASLLARVNGLLPGLIPDLLGVLHRAMPAAVEGPSTVQPGAILEENPGLLFRTLTALGRRAAARLNEGS